MTALGPKLVRGFALSETERVKSSFIKLAHASLGNWFLIWIAAWMAAIYAERIAVDLVIRKNMTLLASATSAVCVLFFLMEWALTFWAFKIREGSGSRLAELLKKYRGDIWSTAIFASVGFYFLAEIFLKDPLQPIGVLVVEWVGKIAEEISDTVRQALPGLAVILFFYLFYKIIARLFRKSDPVYVRFREWTLSFIPVVLGLLFYLAVYRFVIFPAIDDPAVRAEAWKGLVKDSFIYTVFSLVVVQGTFRYRQCCDAFVHRYAKWLGFAIFLLGVANIAALALWADLSWLDYLKVFGSGEYPDSLVYPMLWWHVIVRDWIMMVPLIATMFIWLAGEMSSAWSLLRKPSGVVASPQ